MLLKNVFLSAVLSVFMSSVPGQFKIGINTTTGALNAIVQPGDKYKMNWIFSSDDSLLKWQPVSQDWGLGRYSIDELNIKNENWSSPAKKVINEERSSLTYITSSLNLNVERKPVKDSYLETYTFTNTTGKKINVSALEIYTPFNDNYPEASLTATNRCNAHIWAGMNASYVNAIRMGGEGPHMGLVFTKGALKSYSINNRGTQEKIPSKYTGSNVRGTLSFNIAPFTLAPNESYTVQWKLFWHKGWNDFYKKAIAAGFVKLNAERYVIAQNEQLNISIDAGMAAGIQQKSVVVSGDSLGEHVYKVYYDKGRKYTILNYLVISSPSNLIDKRVHFIVDHQQMNDTSDGRYGAYMVYDNEANKILTNPGKVAASDKDEGRERLGMGVLVAKWLQTHKDTTVFNSLCRYVNFIRFKLQTPDFKLYSNIAHTSRPRAYNYPWVAHLYLEVYKLTNDRQYLHWFYETLRKCFRESGLHHYSIGFRVKESLDALEQAGMKAERDTLLNDYKSIGDYFTANGIHYPRHEVNYEQAIVAPSVTLLCELYLVTKEAKYLDGARKQLPSLEAFNGKQPDVHLYEIPIRHWDGYWFGKIPTWGDIMPHYWSVLTADAYHRYYQCSKDSSYEEKARIILHNNLLNFKENGTASCAYIYPAFVNNKPGKYYDQYANDQDWALVYYLGLM